MRQEIGGVLVDAKRARLLELVQPIAAAEEADAQGSAALRRQHVPDAVADDESRADRRAEARGGGEEEIRIGFGVANLIAGDDRRFFRIDAERREIDRGRLDPAACGDRPSNAGIREVRKQFARARQRSNAAGVAPISLGVSLAQSFHPNVVDLQSGFAKKLIGEQSAAHTDLTMDAPDRKLNAFSVERVLRSE